MTDLRWDPPGPGGWWLELGHFPRPASVLFADLFPPVFDAGRARGAANYGKAHRPTRWAQVNGWFYFGADLDPPPSADDDAEVARAIAERRWGEETRRWYEVERPMVVAASLALQREDVGALSDPELADHVARAMAHYRTVGPLHFEHQGDNVVNRVLKEEAKAAGIEGLDLDPLLAGSSPASRRPAELVDRIAAALAAAGVDSIGGLDDVRRVPAAGAVLDAYLEEYGHRLVESYDLVCRTLLERPELVLAAVRSALGGTWRATPASPAPAPWRDGSCDVAPEVADRLDSLLADACEAHGVRDDDDGTCFFWPMGLIRRAALELGRRLVSSGRLEDEIDVLDASEQEVLALAAGGSEAAPSAEELAARRRDRLAAGELVPPASLHEPATAPTTVPDEGVVRGIGIGTGRATGRAVVHRRTGDDALVRIEPGDVLVAVTTTPAFNTVFPLLAAVVTSTGSSGSHAALVARELDIPAVVAAAGALDLIADGDLVTVDAEAGTAQVATAPDRRAGGG